MPRRKTPGHKIYVVFSEGTSAITIDHDKTVEENNVRAMSGLLHHGFRPLNSAIEMANELRAHGIRAYVAELGKFYPESTP